MGKNPALVFKKFTKGAAHLGAGVQLPLQRRLFPGSGILMQDALCSSLIDLLDGNAHSGGLILRIALDSGVGLLDLGLQLRIDGLVLHGFGGNHLHALFCRLDIWHEFHLLAVQSRKKYNSMGIQKKQVFFDFSISKLTKLPAWSKIQKQWEC